MRAFLKPLLERVNLRRSQRSAHGRHDLAELTRNTADQQVLNFQYTFAPSEIEPSFGRRAAVARSTPRGKDRMHGGGEIYIGP